LRDRERKNDKESERDGFRNGFREKENTYIVVLMRKLSINFELQRNLCLANN